MTDHRKSNFSTNDILDLLEAVGLTDPSMQGDIAAFQSRMADLQGDHVVVAPAIELLTEALEKGDEELATRIGQALVAVIRADKEPLEPRPPIFDAIDSCDVASVMRTLDSSQVNARYGRYRTTALYRAMSAGIDGSSIEIMHVLLDYGADPRLGIGDHGVLHGLGFLGNLADGSAKELSEVIKRCVGLGANLEEQTNELQWTPLLGAVDEWNELSTEALLMAGADPNARSGTENRALTTGQSCLAMSTAKPAIFELLLQYGADPSCGGDEGTSIRPEIERFRDQFEPGGIRDELTECLALLDLYAVRQ